MRDIDDFHERVKSPSVEKIKGLLQSHSKHYEKHSFIPQGTTGLGMKQGSCKRLAMIEKNHWLKEEHKLNKEGSQLENMRENSRLK